MQFVTVEGLNPRGDKWIREVLLEKKDASYRERVAYRLLYATEVLSEESPLRVRVTCRDKKIASMVPVKAWIQQFVEKAKEQVMVRGIDYAVDGA
jgi:hypothetical protein